MTENNSSRFFLDAWYIIDIYDNTQYMYIELTCNYNWKVLPLVNNGRSVDESDSGCFRLDAQRAALLPLLHDPPLLG